MNYLTSQQQQQLQTLQLTQPFIAEVLRQLERILASPPFERLQQKAKDFLSFVVSKTLLDQREDIKETTVAVYVYGESGVYDPAQNCLFRRCEWTIPTR